MNKRRRDKLALTQREQLPWQRYQSGKPPNYRWLHLLSPMERFNEPSERKHAVCLSRCLSVAGTGNKPNSPLFFPHWLEVLVRTAGTRSLVLAYSCWPWHLRVRRDGFPTLVSQQPPDVVVVTMNGEVVSELGCKSFAIVNHLLCDNKLLRPWFTFRWTGGPVGLENDNWFTY